MRTYARNVLSDARWSRATLPEFSSVSAGFHFPSTDSPSLRFRRSPTRRLALGLCGSAQSHVVSPSMSLCPLGVGACPGLRGEGVRVGAAGELVGGLESLSLRGFILFSGVGGGVWRRGSLNAAGVILVLGKGRPDGPAPDNSEYCWAPLGMAATCRVGKFGRVGAMNVKQASRRHGRGKRGGPSNGVGPSSKMANKHEEWCLSGNYQVWIGFSRSFLLVAANQGVSKYWGEVLKV